MVPNLKTLIKRDWQDFLFCFDPGGTTGYALFNGSEFVLSDQLSTAGLGQTTYKTILGALTRGQGRAIIEDYRVYSNKSDSHKLAELHTAKLIGMIIGVCCHRGIPYHLRMAADAKAFCTDDKLSAWGLYVKGQRHARDAMRHGCYSLIFDSPEKFKLDY